MTLAILTLISCKENDKKTERKETIEEKNQITTSLTKKEKLYISNRLEEFKEIKEKLNEADDKNIGKLNRELDNLADFPDWFSKNTQEIRNIKLLKTFLIDLGNGIAIKNKQLIEIANNDFKNYSNELENMLIK